jgi:mannose-6-phosphate isomerase-like protein (cupin superfamily)
MVQNADQIQMKRVPEKMDVYAPDTTEIRLLTNMSRGSMVHCVLPAGQISLAGMHHTVEEIWYVLQGQGEVWLKRQDEEREEALSPDMSFTIPAGTQFQVRNTGAEPLCCVIVTMPPWPGEQEWERVVDHFTQKR